MILAIFVLMLIAFPISFKKMTNQDPSGLPIPTQPVVKRFLVEVRGEIRFQGRCKRFVSGGGCLWYLNYQNLRIFRDVVSIQSRARTASRISNKRVEWWPGPRRLFYCVKDPRRGMYNRSTYSWAPTSATIYRSTYGILSTH